MASRGRSVLLRLTGDPSDAKRAVNEVRADLRRMSREEARVRVDIQTARVERQIQGVRDRLDRLSRQAPSVRVDIQTARAREQLALLEFRLDRLALKRVHVDVDVNRGKIEQAAAGIGAVERGLRKVTGGFANIFNQVPIVGGLLESAFSGLFTVVSGLGSALGGAVTRGLSSITTLAEPIGSVVGSVASLAGSLIGLAAIGGAVVIALNAILGAIIALGGALVALVASAAAAAAGLGALAVAAGAVLIPALIVGIAVFQRFQAVLAARKAHEQALTQAVQDQKTAEQQRMTALQSVKDAQQQLSDATVAGNRAMTQSIQDLRDAQLGLESSQLGVKEARLNMLEAKRALREFLSQAGASGPTLNALVKKFSNVSFDPSTAGRVLGAAGVGGASTDPLVLQQKILAVQRAQLGVKESINQTAHAEETLAQATKTRSDFVRRGLDAYKPYRQALENVSKAEARLRQAENATSAAHNKYEHALKQLSTTERGSLSRLNEFMSKFKELAKAVADPVFTALNAAFDKLSGTTTGLKGVLTEVGRAMGDVIRAFANFLTQPATLSAFRTLATGAAGLVRELGAHAFISFLTIMREIATAALPAVERAAHGVSTWLGRIASQPGRIHSVVHALVVQFQTWLRFAGAVSRLVLALFSNAAPAGRSLAASMTRIVNRWTEWIKSNPGAVRRFFADAVRKTQEIVHWLKEAFTWLRVHIPKAADTAKHAFEGVYRVVKKVVDIIRSAQDLTTDIANSVGLGANPTDVAKTAKNDLAIVNRDLAQLKQHQTPERRVELRKEVVDALNELLNRRGSVGRQLNISDAARTRLENILAQIVAAQGRRPSPRSTPERPSAPGRTPPRARTSAIGAVHITVPGGGSPDPRTLAAKLERELRLAG